VDEQRREKLVGVANGGGVVGGGGGWGEWGGQGAGGAWGAFQKGPAMPLRA